MGRFSSSLTYTLSTVLALLLVSFGYSALKKYRLDGSSDETAVNLARAIYTSGLADSKIEQFLLHLFHRGLELLAELEPLIDLGELRYKFVLGLSL